MILSYHIVWDPANCFKDDAQDKNHVSHNLWRWEDDHNGSWYIKFLFDVQKKKSQIVQTI